MRKRVTGILTVVLVVLLTGQAWASTHVVQPGDTLWLISQRYNTTVADLARANNIVNVHQLLVGQRLTIPGQQATQPATGQTVHTVRAGETLWLISRQYNTTVAALVSANNIVNQNVINVGDRLVIPGSGQQAAAPAAPSTPAAPAAPSTPVASRGGSRTFSVSELDLFARLVHAEAAGEPFVGQVAVAASILNRLDSPRYPNTLTAVIYQVESGFYQYSPVLDGRINLPANETARRAVQEAINGNDPSLGATGFYNPAKTTNQWVRQQPVTVVIANHIFFR